MNKQIQWGWRVPDFPVSGESTAEFRDRIIAYGETARQHCASLWVADHFVPWFEPMDPRTDTLEAWTTLTYLAARFPEMLAGNLVLSQSYRPPAMLAKMGATLQALTHGRFILGIGAGWKEDEYLAYGYDFPSAAVRIAQLEEAVRIIKLMWTEPRATFHGRYYHIEGAICEPKPVPIPPIVIGGGGRKLTLRVVAEHADWWNIPGSSPEEYAEMLETLRGHCQAVGRDYDEIVKTWSCDCVALAPKTEAAQALAQAHPLGKLSGGLIGNPDEVAAALERYTRMGVEHFILRFLDFPKPDGMELFFKEVAPRFV